MKSILLEKKNKIWVGLPHRGKKIYSLCYSCFAMGEKKIRAFKLGCLWFNSNSVGCILFLPQNPLSK